MKYEVTNKIWNTIRHDTRFSHASTKKIVHKFHRARNFYRREWEISDNWEIFSKKLQLRIFKFLYRSQFVRTDGCRDELS